MPRLCENFDKLFKSLSFSEISIANIEYFSLVLGSKSLDKLMILLAISSFMLSVSSVANACLRLSIFSLLAFAIKLTAKTKRIQTIYFNTFSKQYIQANILFLSIGYH